MSGCIQCGSCCKKYGMRLDATPLDIARWRLDDRQDILRHVGIDRENGEVSGGRLWVDSQGNRVEACPFLLYEGEKYFCSIHNAEPEVCAWHYCDKYL
jgi:Fe-S-cluster containining protein